MDMSSENGYWQVILSRHGNETVAIWYVITKEYRDYSSAFSSHGDNSEGVSAFIRKVVEENTPYLEAYFEKAGPQDKKYLFVFCTSPEWYSSCSHFFSQKYDGANLEKFEGRFFLPNDPVDFSKYIQPPTWPQQDT